MSTQSAIITQGHGDARVVRDHPIPELRDDYILVRVAAVALNPTDWNHVDWFGDKGVLVGCDYAGTVEEIGKGVSRTDLKKGDRVAGFVHGCE